MNNLPRFEKVNNNTIRIISEKVQDVPLANVLETKKQLEEKLAQLTETLKNVNDIIKNAEYLGIVAEEKEKKND